MKKLKYILLVVICIGFVTKMNAQRRYKIENTIGLQGGITQFDIITDNFETKQGTGYIGGLTAAVDIPHKWYNLSYNIQFAENTVEISSRPSGTIGSEEFIEYKMMMAQISFLGHLKLIKKYLTIDAGPMVQYNSKLKLDDESKEDNIITGYDNLSAKDITDISRFNVNGLVGLSAGTNHFRVRAHYIYGFLNTLNKLNDNNFNLNNGDRFEGNQSMLVFSLLVSF
tara:strand:- start:1441 stop:2118 length:678 start_codon:yes stop_codon:yes gene_type:complete